MANSVSVLELTFRRKDFEEIYFINKQENIFLSETIKQRFIIFFVFTLAFLISMSYSIYTNNLFGISAFTFILSAMSGVQYLHIASKILKWKRSISNHLKDLSKIKHFEIHLTATSISLLQDNAEVIVKWDSISKAKITENYIMLFAVEHYLYPKKAMEKKDYEYLKSVVIERIKIHSNKAAPNIY